MVCLTSSQQTLALQVLQFVITTATELGETRGAAELALQLFLTAAGQACEVPGLEDIAYELFEQVRCCGHVAFVRCHSS